MAKKTEMIEIPLSLAKLLAAEKEDYSKPEKYEEVQAVAKSLIKVLIEAEK